MCVGGLHASHLCLPVCAQLWGSEAGQALVARWPDSLPIVGIPDAKAVFHAADTPLGTRVDILRQVRVALDPNLLVRVVMAGMSGSGKTSFVNVVVGGAAVEDAGEGGRTQGMDVRMVAVPGGASGGGGDVRQDFHAVLMDFGGHNEYYAIQAGFLSSNCVVVLTVDLSRGGEAEMKLWLESLLCSIGRGGQCGVVLLGTHLDKVCVWGGVRVWWRR